MKRLLLLTSLLAFGVGASAQMLPSDISMPEHVHSAANVPVINGSVNPELIPDSTAYRLFFVSVADGANPAPDETACHKSHLAGVHLKETDGQSLANAVRTFKQQYDDLIKNYNGAAAVAILQGESPDYAAFLRQREAVVQTTRDKLMLVLSPDGMVNLDAFVRGEKRKMRIQPAQ